MADQALCIDLDLHSVKVAVGLELNAFDEVWIHFNTVCGEKVFSFCDLKFKKSMHLTTKYPTQGCIWAVALTGRYS
jgi:hypothetical protein